MPYRVICPEELNKSMTNLNQDRKPPVPVLNLAPLDYEEGIVLIWKSRVKLLQLG
jgi:hypothetical protein